MEKHDKKNSNNSMFIYTALIFIVALIFIILAFFGQKNLTQLRKETESIASSPQATAAAPESTTVPNEEIAIMANTISALKSDNDRLKASIDTYDKLLSANGYLPVGSMTEAGSVIADIDRNSLTEDQKILFDQITNTINEGKEQ